MIRAISYDKERSLFVLEENVSWTLSSYPKGYSFLSQTLDKMSGVDYQRILPVHNGLGNSVMQRALRMANNLDLKFNECNEVDSEDFATCFVDHHWLKSYVGGKLADYVKHVKTDFPTENKDLDDVVNHEMKNILMSDSVIESIPLVNEFALTFKKGYELEQYVNGLVNVPPRKTGIVIPDSYHIHSEGKHNIIVPFVESNSNRNSSKKSLRKKSEIAKAFVRNNFWDNVSIHGLIIDDGKSVYYERTF